MGAGLGVGAATAQMLTTSLSGSMQRISKTSQCNRQRTNTTMLGAGGNPGGGGMKGRVSFIEQNFMSE
jgi:hypothetical protein